MRNTIIVIIVIVVLILIGWGIKRSNTTSPVATSTPTATQQQTAANLPNLGTAATANDIVVTAPASGATISSPLQVAGKARGGWFFEASAPVAVINLEGKIVGEGHVEAVGDWMTSEFVPFKGTITFTASSSSTAAAVLFMNDNPSGQASTSKYLAVPVFFATQ
ncbi:Gmad2 immunoglobulin-like domain-containing protein [Candidatus Parcubacteria bacterium]|nr:Gmad2 immunoglobulin-like domain-containing protein [Candidatus Parcubacteria bacterium]